MPWSRNSQRRLDHFYHGYTRHSYMLARAHEIATEEFIQETQAYQVRDVVKSYEEHETPLQRRQRLLRCKGSIKYARIIDPSLDESWYHWDEVRDLDGQDIELRMRVRYPHADGPFDFSFLDVGRMIRSESEETVRSSGGSEEESPDAVYEGPREEVEGEDEAEEEEEDEAGEDGDNGEKMEIDEEEDDEDENVEDEDDEEEDENVKGKIRRGEGNILQEYGVTTLAGHFNGKANAKAKVDMNDEVDNKPDDEMNAKSHEKIR